MNNAAEVPVAPRASYRLQFNKDFRFEDAARVVPYLAGLGVSHVYASPLMMARPGSMHGYDIVDHNRLNPEIGDEAAFDAFIDVLHRHGMGLILDFVPNHMGVGADNPWWVDVLEWGRASPYADFFEIDWEPAEPSLAGKVLLPVLGDHYGAVLERGELQLGFDPNRGTFHLDYFDNRFPIAPRDYAGLLHHAAERMPEATDGLEHLLGRLAGISAGGGREIRRDERRRRADEAKRCLCEAVSRTPAFGAALRDALGDLNGEPGRPESFDPLHRLLERQAYRLAFWRVAAHEINYRRFFDINDLAGLRMEQPALFEASHRLVRRLLDEGKVQGLRLDHVDGLRAPKAYFEHLQAAASHTGAPPLYVLVEKILAPHESLRDDWPVAGTTGYEFMNEVNGLFVDPAGARGMTRSYERFIARSADFDELVQDAKRLIMREVLASELTVLANAFSRIAKRDRATRDYSLIGLRAALSDVVAYFLVYRTYVTDAGAGAEDRRDIDWAVGRARKNARTPDASIYDFIHGVLTLDLASASSRAYRRRDVLDAALKFQQYTGPLMAKAMEDTAFYRYFRLVSLNEVGGDPGRFGVAPGAFHAANQRRHDKHPLSMVTTATHDHKRGEDVRARVDVLSEMPRAWSARVQRWARLNQRKRRVIETRPAPGRNDEYLFYQTIVGAWPYELVRPDFAGIDAFRERVSAYVLKAAREAKARTSWAAPDAEYEDALGQFVARVLDPAQSRPFLEEVAGFVDAIAAAGAVNGLAQTLLKLACPGVPDIYQGTELWDLSLVDPDNRRPVDYDRRAASLGARSDSDPDTLLASWRDGCIKQHVIHRTLRLRRCHPDLFAAGSYLPLEARGAYADRVVAFARMEGERAVLAIVPRLVRAMIDRPDIPLPDGWADTHVVLPATCPDFHQLFDTLTGAALEIGPARDLPIARVLQRCPVALLFSEPVEDRQ